MGNDIDDDGVCDFLDNCTLVPNGADHVCTPSVSCTACAAYPGEPCVGNQIDSDLDGFGNVCDPDYDNGLFISGSNFNAFRPTFGSQPGDPAYADGRFDMDNDGSVGGPEFNFFRLNFGEGFPGFSGLACKRFLYETESGGNRRVLVAGTNEINSEWNGTSCPPSQ